MPQSLYKSGIIQDRIKTDLEDESSFKELLKPISPKVKPLPPRVPMGYDLSDKALQKRRDALKKEGVVLDKTINAGKDISAKSLTGNIENLVGFCEIPFGMIGPLRINGTYANDDFYIPLACTEGALIASYHRGASVISQAGGASVICLTESISRAPSFTFATIAQGCLFLNWLYSVVVEFDGIIAQTTNHGKLSDIKTSMNGSTVHVIFEYETGDAAGQNMVTIATEAACNYIVKNSPVQPDVWYLEGNLAGDKKASMISFLGARGKKVIAEAFIPEALTKRFLHCTPAQMTHYIKNTTLGSIQSGSIGAQGHYANALAALFIACGQDAACVAEAAVGLTDMEVASNGDLHISVSLPNLTVGTVGGGTHLPTARECLEMLGCYGTGKVKKFAEICAATVLAGELSIMAALTSGEFGNAHAQFRHKTV